MKPEDVGIQSYCFRHFKENEKVADLLLECGLNKIEICAVHADFHDLGAWSKVVDTYKSKGIDIVSIGVETLNGDPTEEDLFKFVQEAGAKHLSVHFRVDTFTEAVPKAASLAEKYDINIGVHCHGGYMFGGSPDVIQHLVSLGEGRVGLNLDTAWCMQIGPRAGKPLAWIDRFPLYGLHFKDFVFEPNGMWKDVVIGEGNLPLDELCSKLKEMKYEGMAVIEYEGDVENPVPALQKCVEKIKASLK